MYLALLPYGDHKWHIGSYGSLFPATMIPSDPPAFDDSPAERTYLAEERTFGAWIRTALTMLVTALAVARFIYEQEPSIEALAISLLLLTCSGGVLIHAQARYSRAIRRASAHGVGVPPRSLRLALFLVLLATVVLAFALVVPY